MFVIGALPAFVALFLQRLLPESPRWLATHGRAATRRKRRWPDRARDGEIHRPAAAGAASRSFTASRKPASWSDLFGPIYLRRTLVVWVIWFAAYFFNYGLVVWLPTIYSTVFKLPLQQALQYGLITQAVGLVRRLDLRADHRSGRPPAVVCVGVRHECHRARRAVRARSGFAAARARASSAAATSSSRCCRSASMSIRRSFIRRAPAPSRSAPRRRGCALPRSSDRAIVGFIVGSGLGTVFLMFAAVAVVGAVVTGAVRG